MIRKKSLFGLVCVSSLALLGPACNGGEDGDDSGSGGSGDDDEGSGGKVGSGGKGSSDGGTSSGGKTATGGKTGTDGGSSSDGGSTTTGGDASTGGVAPTGGNPGAGGMGGVVSGGSAGEMGYGGEGGAPPEPWECGGCLKLFVPLTTSGTGTNFQVGLSPAADMTDEVVTFRIKVVSEGTGGFYQFYGTNDGTYASYYSGWVSLSTASDFIEAELDLGALTDPFNFNGQDFSKSAVRWFGIEITGGNSADAALGDTTMYVDSITFADGSVVDFEFDTSASGFAVNTFNNPVSGSTAEWIP